MSVLLKESLEAMFGEHGGRCGCPTCTETRTAAQDAAEKVYRERRMTEMQEETKRQIFWGGAVLMFLLALMVAFSLEAARSTAQCKAALEAKAEALIVNKVCR